MSFPALNYLSNAARTEGEMKTAFEDWLKMTKQIPGAGIAEQALTISTGSITPAAGSGGILIVDTEASAATDDLTNIAVTNLDDGSMIVLHSAADARLVVVKNSAGGSGQIVLRSGADFTLGSTTRNWLLLRRSGTTWTEIERYPAADFVPILTKTGTYTTTNTDRGQYINVTSGTFTINLLAAATAGLGFEQVIRNSGTGIVTVDPNSSETIDGFTTLTLYSGDSCYIMSTGSGNTWLSISRFSLTENIQVKTGVYTVVNTDRMTIIDCTSGTFTLTLTAAATLGNGFNYTVRNSGTGVVTVDANASETIDGLLTITLQQGQAMSMFCDGSNWKTQSTNTVITIPGAMDGLSGTSRSITTIGPWAKRVTVSYQGLSASGTSIPLIQLGPSGGPETTGYVGMTSGGNGASTTANHSTGVMLVGSGVAAGVISGAVTFTLMNAATNLWSYSGTSGNSDTATGPAAVIAGNKPLAAVLTQVRMIMVNGTDTFDAGNWNVSYE
jgi:hypothetical protein